MASALNVRFQLGRLWSFLVAERGDRRKGSAPLASPAPATLHRAHPPRPAPSPAAVHPALATGGQWSPGSAAPGLGDLPAVPGGELPGRRDSPQCLRSGSLTPEPATDPSVWPGTGVG